MTMTARVAIRIWDDKTRAGVTVVSGDISGMNGVLSVDARLHDEDLQVGDVHPPGWRDYKY